MKFLKNILRNSAYAVMAVAAAMSVASCSSDEEHLLEKYYDIPAKLDVEFGETFDVFRFKGDDDMMVIPSAVGNMTYNINDTKIVSYDRYEQVFEAVGVGSTTIDIYNADEELVRSIPVTVTLDLPFPEKIDVKYGESFSVFDDSEHEARPVISKLTWNIEDTSIVKQDWYYSQEKDLFNAVAPGSTVINCYINGTLLRSIPVTVTPQAEVTLLSGQIRNISDLVPDASGSFSSDDSNVARYYSGQIVALKAGTTRIYNNSTLIMVTVNAGSLTDLFPSLAALPSNANESDIDKLMAGYNCTFSGESVYPNDGRTYYVKEYKPFGNSVSVEFYFEKVQVSWVTPSFKFAIVMTGKESDQVLAWLCNNFTPVFSSYSTDLFSYFRLGDRMDLYKIYPEDGDWNKLKIKF